MGRILCFSQNDKLSKREKWKILRQKTERDVDVVKFPEKRQIKNILDFVPICWVREPRGKIQFLKTILKKIGIDNIDQLKIT